MTGRFQSRCSPDSRSRARRCARCATSLWAFVLLFAGLPGLSASLRINEVVSRNQTGLLDGDGDHPDWIELWNPGPESVNLEGWSLSDEARRPWKWTFATGVLPPGGFLVAFASAKDRQTIATPPIEPAQVPGLIAWLSADNIRPEDPSQVRQANGVNFVLRWRDASGRGRDARQIEAAHQPRLVGGDRPSVRFDGTDDVLEFVQTPATNSFTIVAVVRPTAAHELDEPSRAGVDGTSGQRWLFGADHGGDTGAGAGLSAGTNGVSLYEHGSSYMPAVLVKTGALGASFAIVSLVYSNREPTLALNGISTGADGPSSRGRVTAPTGIGAGSYGAFAGDVAEVVVFARGLSESERRGVEEALARRHALALTVVHHTNFRLDGAGERLLLTAPDGTIVDDLRVPELPRDIAWGRPGDAGDTFLFLAEPTPGAPNGQDGATSFLAPPQWSHPPGFKTNALDLTLISPDPGAAIRFTLDGSEPHAGSPLYVAPIPITNRSSVPNRLSLVPTAGGWQPPSRRVFKGTVVRARSFRAGAIPSDTVTATYFVNPQGRARYTLPVVSLVTDDRHFFNADTGIYVPGNAPGGNYAQSGDSWERPVHVEFFETEGGRAFAQEAGVRMHGNTSFGFPIKALRLHPENQRGTGPFRHRIFPDLPIDEFHRLLLRPSGHDHYLTMMRDGLMQGLVRELGLDLQAYRPAILFINGEYWGLHNLQEALEKNYFAHHHSEVNPAAVDYLEGYAPATFAYEGDAGWYHDLVRYMATHPAEQSSTLDAVATRMDVANYCDYKLTEIFYYRWDIGNHRLWRPRTPAGRLRWILFDCDVGFGGFWSVSEPWSFDMLTATLEPSGSLHGHNNETTVFLLQTLLRNADFRDHFIHRAMDLMNGPFRSEHMLDVIDRMAAGIAPEMREHIDRWRAPSSMNEWTQNVEDLRIFARQRPGQMRLHLARRFGMGPTASLRVLPSSERGGQVRINTLTLPGDTSDSWQGIYFRQHPMTIEAIPGPGWRFAGWTGLPGITQAAVTLSLQGDLTLQPIFAPEEPPRFGSVRRRIDGRLALQILAPPGSEVALEDSADLASWRTSVMLTVGESGEIVSTHSPARPSSFLRLRVTR